MNFKDKKSTGTIRVLNYQTNSIKNIIRNTNVRMSGFNSDLKVFIVVCGLCSMGNILKMKEEMNTSKVENRILAFFI